MGGCLAVSGTWLAPPSVMETELFAACTEGDVAKAKELLKKETKETIDQVDFYGYTALHAACESGHPDLILPLLEAGADINRATYDATFTSLHHAIAKGKWDCARILIEKGADLDLLNEGGCFGSSLHYAVYQGNEEFVKLLLAKGADVNSISGQGYTPLHMAVINCHDALVPVLIVGGADIDLADEESLTPLHMAARDGQGEIALMLVKAGSNLHATNIEGKTPELLANFVNEQPMEEFLKRAATGIVGPAPGKQERAPVVQREIVVPAGWGPG